MDVYIIVSQASHVKCSSSAETGFYMWTEDNWRMRAIR